jgi:hypothetical protein
MKIKNFHSGVPLHHNLTVLKTLSNSLKYKLVVFLFYKSKQGWIVHIQYMYFTSIHLKVYDIPIVFQLSKNVNRCASSL